MNLTALFWITIAKEQIEEREYSPSNITFMVKVCLPCDSTINFSHIGFKFVPTKVLHNTVWQSIVGN